MFPNIDGVFCNKNSSGNHNNNNNIFKEFLKLSNVHCIHTTLHVLYLMNSTNCGPRKYIFLISPNISAPLYYTRIILLWVCLKHEKCFNEKHTASHYLKTALRVEKIKISSLLFCHYMLTKLSTNYFRVDVEEPYEARSKNNKYIFSQYVLSMYT